MHLMEQTQVPPQRAITHFDSRLTRSLLQLKVQSQAATASTWGGEGLSNSGRK
jgi:hypothetical protein